MLASPFSARAFFRDPLGFVRGHADLGPVRLAAGPSRFVLLREPEAIWRILVTDADSFQQGKWKRRARRFVGPTLNTLDGAEHRRRRLLLQPAFDRRCLAAFAPAIVARADRAQARWEDGARLVLRDELDPLALAMVGEALLSTDLEPQAAGLAKALRTVVASVPRLTPPLPGTSGAKALADVQRALDRVIEERRNGDLVSTLLASGLSEALVRGELTSFLLATVDEPTSALETAWYLLGRARRAEKRLHVELDSVLEDRPVTLDDEERLPYLGAVILESLRLFPPARYVDRCPAHEISVDGASLPAGVNVLLSPLVTHRDPSVWERPDEFMPERWLGDKSRRPSKRGAYVPFGAGAHTCIGEPLARMIMTLSFATIARRWRLRVDESTPAPAPRVPPLVVTLEKR
jgi:cytochrome P450